MIRNEHNELSLNLMSLSCEMKQKMCYSGTRNCLCSNKTFLKSVIFNICETGRTLALWESERAIFCTPMSLFDQNQTSLKARKRFCAPMKPFRVVITSKTQKKYLSHVWDTFGDQWAVENPLNLIINLMFEKQN